MTKKTGGTSKNHHILCAHKCSDEMSVWRIDSWHSFHSVGGSIVWSYCRLRLIAMFVCRIATHQGAGSRPSPSPRGWSTLVEVFANVQCVKQKLGKSWILSEIRNCWCDRQVYHTWTRGESITKNTIYIYYWGSLKSPQSCTLWLAGNLSVGWWHTLVI